MRAVIESLRSLQSLMRDPPAASASSTGTAQVEELRRRIPLPVLTNFDAMIQRGRTAITVAVNGVCSGCHLQLSSGTLSGLRRPNTLERCDNCGRYVYLPETTPTTAPGGADFFMVPGTAPTPRKRARRQKAAA